jgi:hypothetical protein
MLFVDDARSPVPPATLAVQGGFAWWYAELLDQDENGVVLIWSYGLPFLPGYTSAARKAKAKPAGERPSLNVAIYRNGKPCFYSLREFAARDVRWDGEGHWVYGDTEITSVDHGDKRHLSIRLNLPVKASNTTLKGTVQFSGNIPNRHGDGQQPFPIPRSAHAWTPLVAPTLGRASLQWGGEDGLNLQGRVYHDRNWSKRGLHDLGIETWVWGRAAFANEDRIFYLLFGENDAPPVPVGFRLAKSGIFTLEKELTLELPQARQTAWGMPDWSHITLRKRGRTWLHMKASEVVDHGPFYLRKLTTASGSRPEVARGSLEIIAPRRIDLNRHRPLVQMRVENDNRRNSMWLPLFQGEHDRKWSQLLQSLPGTLRRSLFRRGGR